MQTFDCFRYVRCEQRRLLRRVSARGWPSVAENPYGATSERTQARSFGLPERTSPDHISSVIRLKPLVTRSKYAEVIPANHAMTCALADAHKDALEAYLLAH